MKKSLLLVLGLLLGGSALASPARAQTLPNVNLVLEPFHASNIYKTGKRVGWTVRA
jgi:hypothetical protein